MSYKSFYTMVILGCIVNFINYIITQNIISIIICVFCVLILFTMEANK